MEYSAVAVYWDFENIHACILDKKEGEKSYFNSRKKPQRPVISIQPVVNYALSFGDVVIHKAYCNWQGFWKYQNKLNKAGMDLIQIFPRGYNAKNGADISLALDAIIDIQSHPHISHVMVISNDSDFVSLAQRIKQMGKKVIGVGLNNANRYWKSSCSEFTEYENLLIDEESHLSKEEDDEKAIDPKVALRVALKQLSRKYDDTPIPKPLLKDIIKRLDPSFDENNLGYDNFTAFLQAFPEIVNIIDTQNVSVAKVLPSSTEANHPTDEDNESETDSTIQEPVHDL